jgi:prepilin-type N-terminal cleavage/methylation domain-containing protein
MAMPTSLKSRKNLRAQGGFSLIEMICVLAVVSVMASLAMPAITGIVTGDRLSNNAYTLSDVIQQARAAAMARHTYVWIGFSSYTGADGVPTVMVASLTGNSGQASDLTSNNYVLSEKPAILRNVAITGAANYATLPGYDSSVTTTDVASQGYSFTASVAGRTSASFSDVIAFNPNGEANLAQSTGSLQLVQCLGMGLQVAPSSSKLHVAAIQVRGLSGDVTVLRQ